MFKQKFFIISLMLALLIPGAILTWGSASLYLMADSFQNLIHQIMH